jgi:hypothetical protein
VTEYRIVATVDPSGVTSGSAKVKQELRGVDTAAAATKRHINQAFDPSSFDRSVGSLISRMDRLDKSLANTARTSASVATSNATVAASLDKLAASGVRAGDGMDRAGRGAKGAATSQASLDAATRRVLQAVDAEAAELMRLNQLLAEAKMLHERGAITATQFARVQTMVTNGTKQQAVSLQQQRAGYMMAGQQMQDWTQQLSLGVNPLVVLAQQGGQTASALQMALGPAGTAGRVAGFIAGPWGSLILAGTVVLGMMIAKNVELGNEIDNAVEKMKKDAHETEVTRAAHERFIHTQEGVRKAILDANEARKKQLDSQKTEAERANIAAQNNLREEKSIRLRTQARLEEMRVRLAEAVQASGDPTLAGEGGYNPGFASSTLYARGVRELEAEIARQASAITMAETELQQSRADLAAEAAKRAVDPVARLNRQYDQEVQAAQRAAVATGKVTSALTAQITAIENRRKAAIKAAQDEERESRRGDGVSRFRSRQQAIGIAGRELQGAGLRVTENEQFGGVHANHPGMGNAGHGKFAIDVNSGRGQVEANLPNLRDQFDELARRYQARGYRVLWNGWVYEANGSGPTRPIPGGQNQHRDHMHVEAPSTIVGKATQASGEQQAIQEWRREQTAAEQQRDFVQGVVDDAASRGQGTSRVETLNARIDKTLADFKRRFDREATPEERKRMSDALTEADARETAQRFEEAYVKPLKRLQDLQGKTGLDRAILNAQLEESLRLGRDLTPVEKERIDANMRQSDALERQADVLANVRGPVEEYKAQIAALNALLEKGAISQTAYNSRIADLGQTARDAISDMPGVDPNTGRSYADLAKAADEDARYARERETFENNREELLRIGLNYDALIEAARRRHVDRLNEIDQARRSAAINSAQSTAESLLSIAEMSAGKQSAIYKALFVVSKAFAIADAIIKIQQGIANALSLPFPANLAAVAAVAAAAASIVSNIQAVSLNLRDGGLVTGPGGPRDDKVPVNASPGEYMVNAAAVARPGNLALLEAINSGRVTAGMQNRRASNDNLASVSAAGDTYQINVGDVIVHSGGMGGGDGRTIGRDVKRAISSIVREEIADAKRSGGALTKTSSSVMSG